MNPPTLLVLAAGMGTRYGGLKQLDTVGPHGETIIDYSLFDAQRAGFGKVVFIIRHAFERAFKDQMGDRYAREIPVAYAYQELDALPAGLTVPEGREKPWGTGHAIWTARRAIDEPFAVINADDFYSAEGFTAAADYLRRARDGERADYCMVGYKLENTLSEHGSVSRGICRRDDAGCMSHVIETHHIQRHDGVVQADDPTNDTQRIILTGSEVASMNLWGFTPSIFDHLESQFMTFYQQRGRELKSEFYIPFVVNELVQSDRARVRVLDCDAKWFGITYREDRAIAQQRVSQLIDAGVYPSPLRAWHCA